MLTSIVLQIPLALFPGPTPPACQLDVLPPSVIEERVIHDFDRRVSHYVRLHRRLERALPPKHLFADVEDMWPAVDALHEALVDARPDAQPGTIFTPAIANVIVSRLEQAIDKMGLTAAEVVIAMNLGYRSGTPKPQVNGRFPASRHVRIWPALVVALPPLPNELEYRVFGGDLVLVDLHADLVVDILTGVLRSPFAELSRDSAPPRKSPHALAARVR